MHSQECILPRPAPDEEIDITHQQREAIDALLRSEPFAANATLAEQRATFEERMTRPLPDGITATATTLGGRPALELSADNSNRPGTVLYLHGGGYVIGSARTGATIAAALTVRTGVRALSLDYRLAPEHPHPAAVEDALAAYRELLDRGTPANAIAIAGDSAGGGLTVAVLLAAREAGLPQPAAAYVLSPWVDLTLVGESMHTKHGMDAIFTRDGIGAFVPAYVGDGDAAAPLVSPVFTDLFGLAPLLVQVGEREVLLDDATRLAAKAATDGVPVTLQVWPGVPHVFQNFTGSLTEADDALDDAARFLTRHLAG